MPITLNVPDWGEVQALTVKEAAKRLGVGVNDIDYWVECDLFESYEWNVTDARSGKLKKTIIYIDLVDLAEVEKLSKRFPPDAPWERILWFRYEQQQHQRSVPDRRATDRTMVQPGQSGRPGRPEPPSPKRRPPLPREIRDVVDEMGDEELLEELEGRQPSRPLQARRLEPARQAVAPAGRQRQRRLTIEDDDYYADPDEPTVRETNQYPKKKQLPKKRGVLW